MTTPTSVPRSAPDFSLHREPAAADTGDHDSKAEGMNMSGAKKAIVQVIPSAAQTPTAEVLFWSEEAGKYISAQTALSFPGPGAGTPFTFTVDCNNQFIFVKITGITLVCKVMVAADELRA